MTQRDQSPDKWEDETEFHLPEDHWPLPELVHTEKPHEAPTTESFVAVSKTAEYENLSRQLKLIARTGIPTSRPFCTL